MLSQRVESLSEHLVSATYSLLYSRCEVYLWILVSLSKIQKHKTPPSLIFLKDEMKR